MTLKLALGACVLGTIGTTAQQRHFDGKSLWRHVEVLAADNMEGRGTGTAGLERAEAYVVEQVKKAGLKAAGVNGYFQPVTLAKREVVDCRAALVRDGRVDPLAPGEEAACTTFVDIASKVDAPLVFLGYGVQVPEKGYDDFAGVDLKGKIAVTIPGLPEGLAGPLAADATAKRPFAPPRTLRTPPSNHRMSSRSSQGAIRGCATNTWCCPRTSTISGSGSR